MTKMKEILMRAPPTVRKWPLFSLAHYGFEARGGLKKDLRVSRVELGGSLYAFFFLLIGDESGSSLH